MGECILLFLSLACLVRGVSCEKSSDNGVGLALGLSIGLGLTFSLGITIFIIFMIRYCSRRKFEKHYNVVDSDSMAAENFEKNRQLIISALKGKNKNFAYYLRKKPYEIIVQSVQTEPVPNNSFLTKVSIKASDHIGKWTSQGYILCRNKEMFFWMLKSYNNKKEAKQNGKWQHLVYQSTSFDADLGVMEGNWFYHGFQTNPRYSGRWKLSFEPTESRLPNLMKENSLKELKKHLLVLK